MTVAVLAAEKIIDLGAEFLAATAAVSRQHFAMLEGHGVSRRFLFKGAMRFGAATIVASGKFYEPHPGGSPAIVLPAIPLSLEDDLAGARIGDLVAFDPAVPHQWWVRTGALSVLNPDSIDRAETFRSPLRVSATPLNWLRNEGAGCVVIDRTADVRLLFGGVARLVADDVAAGDELDRAWRRRERKRPEIYVVVRRGK